MKTLEQLLYEAKFTQEQIDKIMDVLIRYQLEKLEQSQGGYPVLNTIEKKITQIEAFSGLRSREERERYNESL